MSTGVAAAARRTTAVDVAIVGLGPVGAVLAGLLGQHGICTIVIDKAADIFPLPRAIGLDHEIMRVLQNLGVAEALAPHVVAYPRTEYRGLHGRVIARFESLPAPWPLGWSPGFMFSQPPFERVLRERLARLTSVTVRLETTLLALDDRGEDVALTVSDVAGSSETIVAQYVVGCDGGSSLVRKLLGIGLQSLGFDEPWLVADVLVRPDRIDRLPDCVVQDCDPERPTTYVVGPGRHRRWEFKLLPGESAEAMNRPDAIWRLLGKWMTPDDGEIWRAATYVFHALVAEQWRCGRVLLAGDAAHMTPPFMAQGMCQGIRDAANLAWKLTLVVKGQAEPALLDSYGQERSPHVTATTETAKTLGLVIGELDLTKAAERDARMLAENGDPPRVRYRQSLIPGLAAGALYSAQGKPVGERFPQPTLLTQAGPLLMDDVAGSGFRLVLADRNAHALVPDSLAEIIEALGGAVLCLDGDGPSGNRLTTCRSIVERDGLLQDWFGETGIKAALVRPDHYVFAIARGPEDFTAMARQLALLCHLATD